MWQTQDHRDFDTAFPYTAPDAQPAMQVYCWPITKIASDTSHSDTLTVQNKCESTEHCAAVTSATCVQAKWRGQTFLRPLRIIGIAAFELGLSFTGCTSTVLCNACPSCLSHICSQDAGARTAGQAADMSGTHRSWLPVLANFSGTIASCTVLSPAAADSATSLAA